MKVKEEGGRKRRRTQNQRYNDDRISESEGDESAQNEEVEPTIARKVVQKK